MGRCDPFLAFLRVLALVVAATAAIALPVRAQTAAPHDAPPAHGAAPAHGPSDTSDAVTAPGEPQHDPGATVHDQPGAGTAQGAHGAEQGEHASEGEHGQGGLPQLDSSTFPSQIFWLIVAFGALLYLLSKRALPRVGEILEARQERIAADLDRAATLRAEAEAAQQRHEQVVAEARARASEQIRAVQERMAAEAAKRQAETDAELDRKLAESSARITAAKEAALAQIQTVAVEVAQTAVERLAGLKLAEADIKAALDRELAEAA